MPPTLQAALRQRSPLTVGGLAGSAAAFCVASLRAEIAGPILWVTADEAEAERVGEELRAFSLPALSFPAWDVPPYGGYSPSAAVSRARLFAMWALVSDPAAVVVAEVAALRKRVLTPASLRARCERISAGADIDRDALVLRLVERGWLSTDRVADPGSFAVRGGLLDLWPPGEPFPYRIELWGDTIESIRAFDPETQRSLRGTRAIVLLPAREEPLDAEVVAQLPKRLKALADLREVAPKARVRVQDELTHRLMPQELELFLPLLEPQLGTVFDLLPDSALTVWQGPLAIETAVRGEAERIADRYVREGGSERLLPAPETLFLSDGELLRLAPSHTLVLGDSDDRPPDLEIRCTPSTALKGDGEGLGDRLPALRRRLPSSRPLLVALRSRKRTDALRNAMAPIDVVEHTTFPTEPASLSPSALHVVPAELPRGFVSDTLGFALYCESDLWARVAGRNKARPETGAAVASLEQLRPGDLVVHADHGIGRFEGLVKLKLGASIGDKLDDQRARADDASYRPGTLGPHGEGAGSNNDYLLLRYRDGDRLYLPVHRLDRLSRYVGSGSDPALDRLGGETWVKRRRKASEAAQKIAKELLALYAKRQVARAHAFAPPDALFREFCDRFPHELTADQADAVEKILDDMSLPKPMDRLLVGDVGFGKTEVAMRAAFRAVEDGKQVAFLVPTTILALQHHQALRDRMDGFPVRIDLLSRFRSDGEQRKTIADLGAGKVDIVVGTHRLLGADVTFADLGLLVVDEEHRFGVTHKERIKEWQNSVDVLTLTATPIPRTLHMALAGIRDLSTLHTPPMGRLPIRTSVARFSPPRVQEAIRFELARSGQVFFVHNRVKTIDKLADWLRRLVPEARMRVAHGQMDEESLERIMVDFFDRKFDVLLSTAIVESGIDVPRANTMIVNRADHMGLAQLHQLRGRVGRGRERGFCYLFVPPGRALKPEGVARLKVLQDHSDLGAGHAIARHDLELRGAGNLLGSKQSGHVHDVGLTTYLELVAGAVRRLRGDRVDESIEPDIDLRADAYIPETYVPDPGERLQEYKDLADATTLEELQTRLSALADRFGEPPREVTAFEQLVEVKVLARQLGILRVRPVRGLRIQLDLVDRPPLDPAKLLALVAASPRRYELKPDGRILLSLAEDEAARPLPAALRALQELIGCRV